MAGRGLPGAQEVQNANWIEVTPQKPLVDASLTRGPWKAGSRYDCWVWVLYGNAHLIAQELGRQVGSIRPDESVKLGMNPELPEYRGVAQRFEDRAAES